MTAGLEATPDPQMKVARRLGFSGLPLWECTLGSGHPTWRHGASLARAPDGAILVASFQGDRYGPRSSVVAKLAIETGVPAWHIAPADPIGFHALASVPRSRWRSTSRAAHWCRAWVAQLE